MDAQPNEPAWQDEPDWENEPDLFDTVDEAAEEAADREAEADIAAGRFIPHEEAAKWLRTWGTPDEKPMPPEWLA